MIAPHLSRSLTFSHPLTSHALSLFTLSHCLCSLTSCTLSLLTHSHFSRALTSHFSRPLTSPAPSLLALPHLSRSLTPRAPSLLLLHHFSRFLTADFCFLSRTRSVQGITNPVYQSARQCGLLFSAPHDGQFNPTITASQSITART